MTGNTLDESGSESTEESTDSFTLPSVLDDLGSCVSKINRAMTMTVTVTLTSAQDQSSLMNNSSNIINKKSIKKILGHWFVKLQHGLSDKKEKEKKRTLTTWRGADTSWPQIVLMVAAPIKPSVVTSPEGDSFAK